MLYMTQFPVTNLHLLRYLLENLSKAYGIKR